MTYEQMKLLVAIAQSGTISDVAEKSNISHSAISRSISNLESALGVTLFKRTRKGSLLTEEGKKAVEIAQQIIDLYGQLEALRQDTALVENLRIGSSTVESADFISHTIRTFKESYPNVLLHFYGMSLSDITAKLKCYEIDIGLSFFVESELQKIKQQFKYKKLLTTRLVTLFNPQSPLTQKSFVTPADLRGYRFVLQEDSKVLSVLKELMGDNGFSIFSHSNQDTIIKEAVSRGDAVTFASEAFILQNPMVISGDLKYAPVQIEGADIVMYYTYYYLPNKPLGLTKETFLKIMERAIAAQGI